jgi:hypothetical protein
VAPQVPLAAAVFKPLQDDLRLVYSSQAPADGKLHEIKVDAFQVVNDQRHGFKARVSDNQVLAACGQENVEERL